MKRSFVDRIMNLSGIQPLFRRVRAELDTIDRAAICVAAVLGSFWLAGLAERWGPRVWTDWGLRVTLNVPSDGYAQLFYNDGSGLAEERSVLRPVRQGSNDLFFPLPEVEGLTITGLRLDPLNGGGAMEVRDPQLDGPFGLDLEATDTLKLKAGLGVAELTETKQGYRLTATTDDPSLRLTWKPKTLAVPWGRLHQSGWLLWAAGLLPMTCALAGLRLFPAILRRVWQGLALGWVLWLLAQYVLPVQRIEEWVFFRLLLAPGLILMVLRPRLTWDVIRELARNPIARVFAGFLAFFGLHALWIPSQAVPARGEVLGAVGALAVWPILAAILARSFPFSARWVLWAWIAAAAGVACCYLYRTYDTPDALFSNRLQITNFEPLLPIYRPISGTACLVLALILLVQSTSWRRPITRHLWLAGAVALPMVVFLLLTQSRSIILGALGACAMMSLARNAWFVRGFAGLCLLLSLWFTVGNAPGWLDHVFDKNWKKPAPRAVRAPAAIPWLVVAGQAQPAKPAESDEATEGGILGRSTGGRIVTWRAFLAKSRDRPIFGHGFAGEQKLYIELPESLYGPGDEHLAKATRSCHNIYVSALYFGGIVGLVLMLGMVGMAWGWPLWLWWKTQDTRFLLATSWMTLGGIALFFESTLLAHGKQTVLLWRPNDYWLFFWGAIVFSIVQTSWEGLKGIQLRLPGE